MNWFRFGNPDFLFLLWAILPLIILLLIYGLRMKRKAMLLFQVNVNATHLKRQLLQAILLMLSFVFVAIAIALPQWGATPETVDESLDVMFALDISTSMLATDGNSLRRLTRAKNYMFSLMTQLEGDRIGLLYFAEASVVVCPLTRDFGTVKDFLSSMTPDTLVDRGTNIANAIEVATGRRISDHIDASIIDADTNGQKVLVLFTDGEDHGKNADVAAEIAQEKGIQIYCVGVGGLERAVPIPLVVTSEGYKRDVSGNLVLTALDEKILRDIAKAGKGQYYHATAGVADLSKDLAKLEKQKYSVRKKGKLQNRFQWFVGIALFLILGEMLIEIFMKVRVN